MLDLGEAGGILVASHLFGEEMHRMVDEPEHRREIDQSLKDVYKDMPVAPAGLLYQGGAQPPGAPARAPRLGCPTWSSTSGSSDVIRSMLERHGLLQASRA